MSIIPNTIALWEVKKNVTIFVNPTNFQKTFFLENTPQTKEKHHEGGLTKKCVRNFLKGKDWTFHPFEFSKSANLLFYEL